MDLLITIVSWVSLAQAVLLFLLFYKYRKKESEIVPLLFQLVLISTIMLAGRLLVISVEHIMVWKAALVVDSVIFLYGPLTYRLNSALLGKSTELRKLHYLPFGIHLLYAAVIVLMNKEFIGYWYSSGYMMVGFVVVELAGLLSLSSYSLTNAVNIRRSGTGLSHTAKRNFAILLLTIQVTISVFWWFSFINAYSLQWPYISYNSVWISISGVNYMICLYILLNPQVFEKDRSGIPVPEAVTPRLNELKVHFIKERITYGIDQLKLHLDPELTLTVFAQKVDSSANDISWVLNKVYRKSFYEYINQQRINAFISKIERKEHLLKTIFALAIECGFNSKSTFNKHFKSNLNLTPRDYIRKCS